MIVEPANFNQIRLDEDGTYVEIDADAGSVAEDLRRIDAGFKVRFGKRGKSWIVFHEWHPGCPHNGDGLEGSTYLVLTAQARQTNSGVWSGLDQRVVRRVEEIGHPGYDYAGELERASKRRAKQEQARRDELVGKMAEDAAHAIRKDLGRPYKGHIFVPA